MPTKIVLSETFFTTTLPAPIIALIPIVIPGKIVALTTIDVPFEIRVFEDGSGETLDLGKISLMKLKFAPIKTSSSIVTPIPNFDATFNGYSSIYNDVIFYQTVITNITVPANPRGK
nr:hypothetical protein [Undibacterium sp.]